LVAAAGGTAAAAAGGCLHSSGNGVEYSMEGESSSI